MMRQAIVTKFIRPTNTLGSRIKASAYAGSITRPYKHQFDSTKNHAAVAMELAKSKGWDGRYEGGGLPDESGCAFVRIGNSSNNWHEELTDHGFTVIDPFRIVDSETIVNYATNDSLCYSIFRQYTQQDVSQGTWCWYVSGTVLDRYRRDFKADAVLQEPALTEAVTALIAYYKEHFAQA